MIGLTAGSTKTHDMAPAGGTAQPIPPGPHRRPVPGYPGSPKLSFHKIICPTEQCEFSPHFMGEIYLRIHKRYLFFVAADPGFRRHRSVLLTKSWCTKRCERRQLLIQRVIFSVRMETLGLRGTASLSSGFPNAVWRFSLACVPGLRGWVLVNIRLPLLKEECQTIPATGCYAEEVDSYRK